ncbi:methyltransferase domain-containing protein [Geoglobus acetivorans]|uniref:methyltransferase domain-containing protein n=1 Tax=Geoglobus acetivorans TaxID=565033 RepID=UPI00064E1D82
MKAPVVLKSGKNFYLVSEFSGELHTHKGIIRLEELKEKSFGDTIRTHLGVEFRILPFKASDFFRLFKKAPTPVMPKDIGMVIAHAGLQPDSLIFDAGTGSGVTAAYFAYFNKYGEVVTVERRPEFAKVARENFRMAGLKNIHQIVGDAVSIADGFKKEFDLVFLDMKNDVEMVPKAYSMLKQAGFLAIYNPYIEQTRAVYEKMLDAGFKDVEAFEAIKVNLEFKRVGTRPFVNIFHTGYIVMGRKV